MSFKSSGIFYADRYFPYGLRRSGLFTVAQADLLEKHGQAYEALHHGRIMPASEEEVAFVAVCRGERPPTTAHEKAWVRFCEMTSLTIARSKISAFGKCDDRDFTFSNANQLERDYGDSMTSAFSDKEDDFQFDGEGVFVPPKGDDTLEHFSL